MSRTSTASNQLFYIRTIPIGSKVILCRPFGEGTLVLDQTRLLQTADRILPLTAVDVPRPLRKRSSTSYGFGIFVGATVEILSFGLVTFTVTFTPVAYVMLFMLVIGVRVSSPTW